MTYQQAKQELIDFSEAINTNDKPARRQCINDYADAILRELSLRHSEARYLQYQSWIVSLTCKLH